MHYEDSRRLHGLLKKVIWVCEKSKEMERKVVKKKLEMSSDSPW